MNCMATWEDGPEYAPIERPSDFQDPDAPPLKIAAPYAANGCLGAQEPPGLRFPGKAGGATVHLVADARGAPRPAGTVCRGVQHDDLRLGLGRRALGFADKPAGWALSQRVALPRRRVRATHGQTSPWPSDPGTVPRQVTFRHTEHLAGSARDRHGQQPRPTSPVTARAVLDAATPGLCICLMIGGLVYVLSPIVLCIGVGLAGARQGREG